MMILTLTKRSTQRSFLSIQFLIIQIITIYLNNVKKLSYYYAYLMILILINLRNDYVLIYLIYMFAVIFPLK